MADRSIRYGALLILAGVIQFIAVMAIAQAAYPCTAHCYNILTNPISDLGNTATSPLWPLFNYSLEVFGAFVIAGILLMRGAFRRSLERQIGILLIVVSSLGAMGVGVVSENVILRIHSLFASVAFLIGGIAVVILGANELRSNRRGYVVFSIIAGSISALLFVGYVLGIYPPLALSGPGFGFGGVERMIAGSFLVWLIVTAVYMLLKPSAEQDTRRAR